MPVTGLARGKRRSGTDTLSARTSENHPCASQRHHEVLHQCHRNPAMTFLLLLRGCGSVEKNWKETTLCSSNVSCLVGPAVSPGQ
ncbi:hypothetical protein KIL84_009408 [Mauremys mutica]|uniref:Uncharacterized protein n=1 Tax=Mauremys mutica TaxID=74926 RepID=A0A9D3XJ24_9SAUR|nr:hypothetical protein KIL84_009408 [Mauremys mutica]